MKLKAVNRLRMDPEHSTLYRGHHVLIVNIRGLITSSDEGYYLHQTRFLSKFELFAEGVPLKAVCSVSVEPHSCVSYFLVPSPAGKAGGPPGDGDPSGGEVVDKGIEIQINTYTGGGVHQDVHIINHTLAHSTIALDWMFAADFADMDEITSGSRVQNGAVERLFKSKGAGTAELTFVYKHPRINHATHIRLMGPGSVAYEREALRTTLSLTPRAAELMTLDIAPVFLGKAMAPWFDIDGKPTCHNVNQILSEQWLAACIGFESSNSAVQAAWDRAAADLWSLQSLQGENEEVFTPMAGIPKYTALFGRDTLMASIQSAMLNPSTLKGSLVTVGRWTATSTEDHFDAQPGKVLHQRQLSPLALLGETPFLHYYGDYSGPGLYIIAAALHFGYTGDRQAFAAIRDNVCATLDWIDRDGDIDGDGFYEYRTLAGKAGIKNQGWKDSGQAILYADGSYVRDPIAVAEVQGLYFCRQAEHSGSFRRVG